jgi:AcrR family transcriptional regulator
MSSEQPLNKRQLQAAATRQRMLDAAREVFEAHGYRATTIGAITQAADTGHGTFYLYFRNKDDAFAQVMTSVIEEMRTAQRAARVEDRLDEIEILMRGYVEVFIGHAGLWRALLEGMLESDSVAQIWLQHRRTFIDRLARRLEDDRRAGHVRPFDDCQQVAQALSSMAEWYGYTHLVLPLEPPGPEAAEQAVRTLTDLWYHAVYGHAPTHPPVIDP